MILVIWLNEAVVGELVSLTILQELIIGCKYLGLVAEQIDNLHRRACQIEIIKLSGPLSSQHPVIDAHVRRLHLERIHADLAERSPIVSEGAVTDSRSRYGREPAVEHGETARERVEHRKLVGL